MAVYVVRNDRQQKPWWADLAGTAGTAVLSNVIKGAFERDAYAREKNNFNKEWAALNAADQRAAEAQPTTLSVESAPEVAALAPTVGRTGTVSAAARDGFLGSALGIDPQPPQIDLSADPEEYRPQAGDGLLMTARKAQYAPARTVPTRADYYARMGTIMSPKNMELAMKMGEAQYGNKFKVEDQLYKGRQLENTLGATPDMNDTQATLDYYNRAGLYGEGDTAARGLNFGIAEYQRQHHDNSDNNYTFHRPSPLYSFNYNIYHAISQLC